MSQQKQAMHAADKAEEKALANGKTLLEAGEIHRETYFETLKRLRQEAAQAETMKNLFPVRMYF